MMTLEKAHQYVFSDISDVELIELVETFTELTEIGCELYWADSNSGSKNPNRLLNQINLSNNV